MLGRPNREVTIVDVHLARGSMQYSSTTHFPIPQFTNCLGRRQLSGKRNVPNFRELGCRGLPLATGKGMYRRKTYSRHTGCARNSALRRRGHGDRCPGTPTGRDHAPHLWTGRALQGNSNGMVILVRANLSGLTWELVLRAIMVVRTHLIFLSGRPLWAIGASRFQVRWETVVPSVSNHLAAPGRAFFHSF